METNIKCPNCYKVITIEVEIESPSDYCYDSLCPECMKDFGSAVHDEIYDEVNDEYISRAEFARDCASDR